MNKAVEKNKLKKRNKEFERDLAAEQKKRRPGRPRSLNSCGLTPYGRGGPDCTRQPTATYQQKLNETTLCMVAVYGALLFKTSQACRMLRCCMISLGG
eukprot:CAMPEP_0117660046 /NCGR_PEP_ID=MMETSP0804-20121206/6758_1 /TAXON_ID=1074897 /ORGANISM="Tetraselmis astigmatica, Strain CCMP880" /LENGTH=97 /DNA_ID=CAMNT_0005466747 /DNA_START=321 /DNA_END=614 /DNA_ORIENTATION=-